MIGETYRRVAERVASLRLSNKNAGPKKMAEEFGIPRSRLKGTFYTPHFKRAVAEAMERKATESIETRDGHLDVEALSVFGDDNIAEFKLSFEELKRIRDNGTKDDEVRRKAAVNIIEFFLNLRGKQSLSVKGRVRKKLPTNIEQELEVLLKTEKPA